MPLSVILRNTKIIVPIFQIINIEVKKISINSIFNNLIFSMTIDRKTISARTKTIKKITTEIKQIQTTKKLNK
jgi:hypothetical protein